MIGGRKTFLTVFSTCIPKNCLAFLLLPTKGSCA